jgi:hypothetical protein
MQTNNKRHNDESTLNLLPKLTNDEYEKLILCLTAIESNLWLLLLCCNTTIDDVSHEDYKSIRELISKITKYAPNNKKGE